MDYLEAIGYLNTETAEGIKPDISRISWICHNLGNPERSYKVIHITGTNGKTSTARMLQSILTGMGFRTALYTSPHMVSYTERLSVDGSDITEGEFAETLQRLVPVIGETNRAGLGGLVTQFEALTAMAFTWFASENVDVAIIEVGMGGRWDATNVVRPDVAVITNVALEHTDRLGTTIEAITGEKAGIIKYGATVVTAVTQGQALAVIDEQCRQAGVSLRLFGRDFDLLRVEKGPDGIIYLTIKGQKRVYPDIQLALKGAHQRVNAVVAVAAAEAFLDHVSDRKTYLLGETIARVLPKVDSPGRLEIITRQPLLVLDGAHNPAGAETLAATVKSEFEYDKLILILAVLEDKDAAGIVIRLAPLADKVITAAVRSPRALDGEKLADLVRDFCDDVTVAVSVDTALKKAREMAHKSDMILVTGSLYTVGEAKETLSK